MYIRSPRKHPFRAAGLFIILIVGIVSAFAPCSIKAYARTSNNGNRDAKSGDFSSNLQYQGYHDGSGCDKIYGWAWDSSQPNSHVNVNIWDGQNYIATVSANEFRQDLLNAGIGNGDHAFNFETIS
jgi:hypothetical protein